jgi:hypothetical protein
MKDLQLRRSEQLELRCAVVEDLAARLRALVRGQRTLEDVVRWGLALSPPVLVADVVAQDEYTHDVLVPHPGGVWLVYDTT